MLRKRSTYIYIIVLLLGLGLCLTTGGIWEALQDAYDYSPDWSPDGRLIAFVCYSPSLGEAMEVVQVGRVRFPAGDIPYSPQSSEICVVNSNGTERKRLTNNDAGDDSPIWSSDGAQIAFISHREVGSYLYLMQADGEQQRRVSHSTRDVRRPAWSPDGKQVAYSSDGIYLLDLVTGVEQQLVSSHADFPTWSPDGRLIAFVANDQGTCQVSIVDASTGKHLARPVVSSCQNLAWSPDGRWLAFVGTGSLDQGGRYLQVLDWQTGEVSTLTNRRQLINEGLVWSRTGDRIFYIAEGEIFGAWVDSRGTTEITKFEGKGMVMTFSDDQNLAISPDGKEIAFVRKEGEKPEKARLWKVNTDGSNLVRLSP